MPRPTDIRYQRQLTVANGLTYTFQVYAFEDGVALDSFLGDTRLLRLLFSDATDLDEWLDQVRQMAAEQRQAEADGTAPLPISVNTKRPCDVTLRRLLGAELVGSSPMKRVYYAPGAQVTVVGLLGGTDGRVVLVISYDEKMKGELVFNSLTTLDLWAADMQQLVSDFRHDTEGTAQVVAMGK